jgi:hypothetical protein
VGEIEAGDTFAKSFHSGKKEHSVKSTIPSLRVSGGQMQVNEKNE